VLIDLPSPLGKSTDFREAERDPAHRHRDTIPCAIAEMKPVPPRTDVQINDHYQ
jgi:hypothetical protein